MLRTIDKGPQLACWLGKPWRPVKKPCADPKKDPPAHPQAVDLRFRPGKRLDQREPSIFELREFIASHSSDAQFIGNRLKARLCRRSHVRIQLFELLAPPGEADLAKSGIAARRDHVCKGKVQFPQGRKCPP